MSKENNISRGGLADKLAGFMPGPPDSVWEGISAKLDGGSSRRKLFVFLALAAGLTLAVTVGISLLIPDPLQDMAGNEIIADPGQLNSQDADNIKREITTGSADSPSISGDINGELKLKTSAVKDRTKVVGLKEKVITTMEEVIGERTDDDVVVAVLTEPEFGNEYPYESKVVNNTVAETVNEDSLLKLLQPDPLPEPVQEKNSQNGKWQIGAALSPQLSYRDAASSDHSLNMDVNNSESAKLTYSGGFQLSYKHSGRLTVESGLYYNKIGVNIGDYSNFRSGLFYEKEFMDTEGPGNVVSISNSMGTIVSKNNDIYVNAYSRANSIGDYHMLNPEAMTVENSYVTGFTQSFEYLEIPLNVKYNLTEGALILQLIGGMSTNFLVNSSFLADTNNGLLEVASVQDVKSINYSGNAGIGFVYAFAENFSFSLEPRFRYYLNSINNSLLPATRPYTFGLRTGINYMF